MNGLGNDIFGSDFVASNSGGFDINNAINRGTATLAAIFGRSPYSPYISPDDPRFQQTMPGTVPLYNPYGGVQANASVTPAGIATGFTVSREMLLIGGVVLLALLLGGKRR